MIKSWKIGSIFAKILLLSFLSFNSAFAEQAALSLPAPLTTFDALSSTDKNDPSKTKAAIETDMGKALLYCRGILNHYEKNANYSRYFLLGVATIGTIAGGVIVPALSAKADASKSAIAAWGGLAACQMLPSNRFLVTV